MKKKQLQSTLKVSVVLLLGALATICILLYQKSKEKKESTAKNNKNKKRIQDLENANISLQNSYLNTSIWAQQLAQQIPNPEEAIKQVIEKLTNLKLQVFKYDKNFVTEIDSAIHNLKGDSLNLSFSVIAKIIENLLEKSFLKNEEFKEQFKTNIEKGKKLNLGNFLQFAKQKGILLEEIDILNVVKDLRNAAVHEISPDTNRNFLINFHVKAIEIIEIIVFEPWYAQ